MNTVQFIKNRTGFSTNQLKHLSTNRRRLFFIMLTAFSAFVLFQPTAARAQCVSLTTLGSAYTQDFDTLSNTAGSTTNNLTITGWFLTESGGGTRDNEQYGVDTGGSNTGDTYSYGTAAATDRALGGLRSGTLIPVFGACFTNNTGAAINSLEIAYTGEQWRLGTADRTDQINFEYSMNAVDLTTGTWTGVAALNFVTPTTVTTGAKDGNAAANRTVLNSAFAGLTIANGATFWIRWTDTDASGADDGLAVDDFSLTPRAVTAASVSVGGRVTTADGRGIRNVFVSLVGANGQTRNAITSTFGYFRFTDIPAGETVVISVSAKRYTFSQPAQIISPGDNIDDLNFTADKF